MKKIALFGGSFDPPHYGHFALCSLTRELFSPQKIVLSVSKNPLKAGATASEAKQFVMVKLLAEALGKTGQIFEVSDWELQREGPSYTIDTLKYLHETEPNAKLLLCIGEDNYRIFHKWKNFSEILQLAHLVVFARQQATSQQFASEVVEPSQRTWVHFDLPLSSTEIRRKIAAESNWQTSMPSSIARYISTHQLYQEKA